MLSLQLRYLVLTPAPQIGTHHTTGWVPILPQVIVGSGSPFYYFVQVFAYPRLWYQLARSGIVLAGGPEASFRRSVSGEVLPD